MKKVFGMPLAIIACFALGLLATMLPALPVTLAAFFLAVGLTCLTYSYLGGQLDSKASEGSGTIGLLSFKLTGSVVTFLVSFLFLNHHLALSREESNRALSLQAGLNDIQVEAGSRKLGAVKGLQLENWSRKLSMDDYFHPALIAARRPYCDADPANCVSLAGFYAIAGRSSAVPAGTMKLCEIDRVSNGEPSEGVFEALTDERTTALLNHLEVQREADDRSLSNPLAMSASYADSGSLNNDCRRIAAHPTSGTPTIRVAALINPEDMKLLQPGAPMKAVIIKVNFMIPNS